MSSAARVDAAVNYVSIPIHVVVVNRQAFGNLAARDRRLRPATKHSVCHLPDGTYGHMLERGRERRAPHFDADGGVLIQWRINSPRCRRSALRHARFEANIGRTRKQKEGVVIDVTQGNSVLVNRGCAVIL